MSKARAAKIANSPDASKHGGKKSGKGGNAKQGGTTGAAQGRRSQGRQGRREQGQEVVTAFGYTLSSEEHAPAVLVRSTVRAEAVGFDFAVDLRSLPSVGRRAGPQPIRLERARSDRGQHRSGSQIGVGVTCPIIRVHPAVVAQAAATTVAALRRPVLPRPRHGGGVERARHRHRWPPPAVRREMSKKRSRSSGRCSPARPSSTVARHYEVDNARLFDPPAAASLRSSCPGSGPTRRSWRAGSGTVTGGLHRIAGSWPRSRRPAGRVLGTHSSTSAGRRANRKPGAPCTRRGRTQQCPGNWSQELTDLDALRAGDRDRLRGRRHRERALRTRHRRRGGEERPGRTRTPGTTTSTSTRSDRIRTVSSAGGSPISNLRSADFPCRMFFPVQ